MKTIVMIPTYNESGNIVKLISAILDLRIKDLEILVVDDNSPDKTWEIVQDLKDTRVHILNRKENKGRGLAGIDGFKEALRLGADIIIEMDADFSHNPKYIPEFLKKLKNVDVVLGSRYLGKEERGSVVRGGLSLFAKNYVNVLLGYRFTDPLSGFRCFRRQVLVKILPKLRAKDYFIVTDVLYRCHQNKFRIAEIPIVFEDRREGGSKLELKIVLNYFWNVLKLKFS